MFSGAVRAVFRKKKGFGFVKILHWLLLVLFSAAAALARLRLLAVGFDADGLPVPMDLNTMVLPAVLVVAAVIAVIMARRYPAQRELCGSMDLYFAFDRSTLAVLLMVLGSFALIGSAVCSLVFSLRTTLTMILSVFLAVGAACLLYATTALRRKAEFPGVALLVPVCAMVLALILFYREHAADPILRHYYVETLALAALTVLLTGLALLLLKPMLAWINVTPESPEVYRAAHTYCAIIFAGIGAQLFYNFICSFLRSMGDSVTPLLFLLFSTILNIGLDLLFIVSFHWGVAGAAIATVAAQLISTVGCFLYAFIKYPKLRLHREDWQVTLGDMRRHLGQGIPLGLQFSVLAVGIIVMQSVVVKFDILEGEMISNAAQNGFGAANKLNNLLMTPMNGLGAAMTSYTAQNMGAGQPERIKKGTLQALAMVSILAGISIAIGLGLSFGGSYLRIFLSVDKVTAETMRYGNTYLYVDLAMYLFLGFIFVVRNCVQGIGLSRFILGAGTAELLARVAVCLLLPAAFAGGEVTATAPAISFYALCAADPAAWMAADAVLMIPFLRDIMRKWQ